MTSTQFEIFATISVVLMLLTLLMSLKECFVPQSSSNSELPYARVPAPTQCDEVTNKEAVVYQKSLERDTIAKLASSSYGLSSIGLNSSAFMPNLAANSISRPQFKQQDLFQRVTNEQSHTAVPDKVPNELTQYESLIQLENASSGLASVKSVSEILTKPALHERRILDEAAINSVADQAQATNMNWSQHDSEGARVEQACESTYSDVISSPPSSSSQLRIDFAGSKALSLLAPNIEWDISGIGSWTEGYMMETEYSVADFLQEEVSET